MKRIAILDRTFAVRNRIRTLAAQTEIEVIETTDPGQLMNVLHANDDIGLVITELEFAQEDGFEIFKKIKGCAGAIPVMVLTAENRRSSFVKVMQLGAADYVLKPFDGDYLTRRITSLMESLTPDLQGPSGRGSGLEIPNPHVDFDNYVEKEIRKAIKGKYAVSLVLSVILDPARRIPLVRDLRYQKVLKTIPHYVSTVLFDTDIFVSYGSSRFVGVFPFCGPENQELIENKLCHVFRGLHETDEIDPSLMLLNIFAAYPEDGQDRETLMTVLDQRMAEAIRRTLAEQV